MKAINIFVLNITAFSILVSCRPQDQQQHDLDPSTKEYFQIKDNSKFIFTNSSDTSVSIEYNSKNFLSGRANPDIENSEIMSYDLEAAGQAKFTVRCQSGGTQFKDQIALITFVNDSTFIGPILFNLGGSFNTGMGSSDSVFLHSNYSLNSLPFTDVIRVKFFNHVRYKEVYFAKKLGLIGFIDKKNLLHYVKRYRLQ